MSTGKSCGKGHPANFLHLPLLIPNKKIVVWSEKPGSVSNPIEPGFVFIIKGYQFNPIAST